MMEKDSHFNECCWENWLSALKTIKLNQFPSPYKSINTNWIKGLNIIFETLKLVWESSGNSLELIDIGNDWLSRTKAAQQLRGLINGTT
jgi:hypothetical protein